MKTLKLKLQDLTNPTILTHHEIKNIIGGSGELDGGTCSITMVDGKGNIVGTSHPSFGGYVTCDGQAAYCSNECMQNTDLWEDGGYCYFTCSACN